MPNTPYAGDCLDKAHVDLLRVIRIVSGELTARELQNQALAKDDAHCLTVMSPDRARYNSTDLAKLH